MDNLARFQEKVEKEERGENKGSEKDPESFYKCRKCR